MLFSQKICLASIMILITFSGVVHMKIAIQEVDGQTSNNSTLSVDGERILRTYLTDPSLFFHIKQAIKGKSNIDSTFQAYFVELIRVADSILDDIPHSVTEKNELPPGSDKHDFLAIAPYHWPNPFEPPLVPYIWHGGIINPEVNTIPDKRNIDLMIEIVATLAAYYFTDDPKYASQATELLRVWFLN